MRTKRLLIPLVIILSIGFLLALGIFFSRSDLIEEVSIVERDKAYIRWFTSVENEVSDLLTGELTTCPMGYFSFPAEGFIGLFYGDTRAPYNDAHRHQGIDIFSKQESGVVPIYAAYDGYLTRETGWISSLIIRIPEDPLDENRQVWLYYTHMADVKGNSLILEKFPQGATEVFVSEGELLGYMGDYSGSAFHRVAVHLHLSIVKDDGSGHYLNELEYENTIDPSPYFGLELNYQESSALPSCDDYSSVD